MATPSAAAPTQTPAPSPAVAWVERWLGEYTSHGGADLAAARDGDTEILHAVVANLEDAWMGPGDNVGDASVYLRTTDGGLTWGKRLVIGGIGPQIAAAGRRVYVAFLAYECKDGIGILRNDDHGLRRAWSDVTCLTRRESALPNIAVTERLVYVASAAPGTGDVVVHISRDRGETWTSKSLGVAHDQEEEDVEVEVAAEGSFVAVAWSNDGVVFARVSDDAGRHWDDATRLAVGRVMSASARDSRVAISGTGIERSGWVQMRDSSGPWTAVAMPNDGPDSAAAQWGVDVVLGPNTGIGIAYDACRNNNETGATQGDTWWLVSADDGATWGTPERIAHCNDRSSPVWTSDGRAFVLEWGDEADGHVLATRP
jgi:hypothetical protein